MSIMNMIEKGANWLAKKIGDAKEAKELSEKVLATSADIINLAIRNVLEENADVTLTNGGTLLNDNGTPKDIEKGGTVKLDSETINFLTGKGFGLLNSKIYKMINQFPVTNGLPKYVNGAIMRKILDDKKLCKMYSKKIPFEQWEEASIKVEFKKEIDLGLAGSKLRSMLYKKFDLKSCLAILGPLSNNNKSKSIQKIKKFVSNELKKIEDKIESFYVKNRKGQEIQTTYDEFNKYSKYYGTVLPLSLYFVANETGDPKLVARIKMAINGLSGDNGKYGTNDLKTTVKDLKAVETDTVEAYAKKLDEKAKEFFKS